MISSSLTLFIHSFIHSYDKTGRVSMNLSEHVGLVYIRFEHLYPQRTHTVTRNKHTDLCPVCLHFLVLAWPCLHNTCTIIKNENWRSGFAYLCTGGAYYVPYSFLFISNKFCGLLLHKTNYAPMIYTALCIMFWMHAYPLRGQVVGGWAMEIENFLGPVKWHRADRRVPFRAQKTHIYINHRCTNS